MALEDFEIKEYESKKIVSSTHKNNLKCTVCWDESYLNEKDINKKIVCEHCFENFLIKNGVGFCEKIN